MLDVLTPEFTTPSVSRGVFGRGRGIDILVSNVARGGDRKRIGARFPAHMERAVSFASQRASRINSANSRLSAIASAV